MLHVSGWTKSKTISHLWECAEGRFKATKFSLSKTSFANSSSNFTLRPWRERAGMRMNACCGKQTQAESYSAALGLHLHASGRDPWAHVPCEFPPHLLERKSCQRTLALAIYFTIFTSDLLHIKRVPNKTNSSDEDFGWLNTAWSDTPSIGLLLHNFMTGLFSRPKNEPSICLNRIHCNHYITTR